MQYRVLSQMPLVQVILFVLLCFCYEPALAIWPMPSTITYGEKALLLSGDFSIQVDFSGAPQDLLDAIVRTHQRLYSDKLGRLVVGRGSSDANSLSNAKELNTLRLSLTSHLDPSASASKTAIKSISDEITSPIDDRIERESYTLQVPSDGGDALLVANSTLGLLRGLSTFEQLWYTYDSNVYAVNTPIRIVDKPAYPYRGFMLDTARNFYPVADILRTLDTMYLVKFNTLYWHIVDSQAFPMEVGTFPELSKAGAYSAEQTYSEDDVQQIISYAAERGVDVVLELDTPGHETAIGYSHPEHIACFVASPWATYANEPPAGQLRLASPATLNFSVKLVQEVSSKFRSSLFSTGGDEVNLPCYMDDPQTQMDLARTGQTIDEALNTFILAEHAVIRDQAKTPIVKEDMILKHNTSLPNSTIAVVWISSQDAKNVTERGYRVIHQPSDYFYLDCGAGEWIGDDIDANSWCDPFKSWQRIYSFDPLANLTAEEAELVIGGQIPLWSEQSGPENLDSIVWPRAASAAEVFWSGGISNGNTLNVTQALPRLHDLRYRIVQRGVKAINLQPEWCTLRPGLCDSFS